MSDYHDRSWRLPDPPGARATRVTYIEPRVVPARPEPTTFRESFERLPEPYRSTFLRIGAHLFDLDDHEVYANACRLADSVPDE